MSLFDKIKMQQVEARKARSTVKASLLTTLLGEISTTVAGTTQQPSDETSLAVIKKFIKNTQETIRLKDNEVSHQELEVLESFMPKQLSDEELKVAVAHALSGCTLEGGKRMGYVMGELKKQYPGQFDASKVKGLL